MTDNFDWQAEDEDKWLTVEDESPPAPARQRPWRLLLLLLLLAGAALLIDRQVERRLEIATANVEADILSSHNLINRAAADQDWDLLLPLISGRESSWTETMAQLVDARLLYDRAFLDLPLAAAGEAYAPLSPADDRVRQITTNPEMNTAELHFLQEYRRGPGEGAVWLEQTAVYRKGRGRWLLSPPDADFWGERQMVKTKWFALFYPARDQAIAERLAEDLTAVIDDVCPQITPLPCFALSAELKIWLDPDPATLLALTNPANLYDGDTWLNLPTPTLVGLPIDEAGYQALLRGYSATITAALITYLAEYECCAHAPFYQVFLEYELSQLGLRPWPVTPATYTQVINQRAYQDDLLTFWRDPSFQRLQAPDGWRLYAFADFVMHQPSPPTPLAVLATLSQTRQPVTWLRWLAEAVPVTGWQFPGRTEKWWTYAQAQMAAAQGAPPIPLPAQDLLLTCAAMSDTADSSALYRYRLADQTWQAEYELAGTLFVTPLPAAEAALLQTIPYENAAYQPLLWRDGAVLAIADQAYPLALSWGQIDPTGRYLLVYASPSTSEPTFQPALVDLHTCHPAGCATMPLSGSPVWSPDGAQTILEAKSGLANGILTPADGRALLINPVTPLQNAPLFRADSVGGQQNQIALPAPGGAAPFWLTNEIYGYVQTIRTPQTEAVQQLVLATTADDQPRRILDTGDLLAAIPEALRPSALSIAYVLPHPTEPTWLAIMAVAPAAEAPGEDFIFLVDWREQVIENRLHFRHTTPHTFSFSPDGRYLLVNGIPPDRATAPPNSITYFLHDIAANQTQTFTVGSDVSIPAYPFDWSADGRWLAHIMDNEFANIINLVAPAYDYQMLLVHEKNDCSSLAWVNP